MEGAPAPSRGRVRKAWRAVKARPANIKSAGGRRTRAAPGDELLHAPVQELANPDLVFGRTGNSVDPAELAEILAGPAVHAEHLSVERHLVDPARIEVSCKENRIGTRSDAERIGSAGRLRAGSQ